MTSNVAQGIPKDQAMLQYFENLCLWLETGAYAELYTFWITCKDGGIFWWIWRGLLNQETETKTSGTLEWVHFFAEIEGRGNFIINKKWYSDKKDDIQAEAERTVIAAVKIIIRERENDSKSYPASEDIVDIAISEYHDTYKHSWKPLFHQNWSRTVLDRQLYSQLDLDLLLLQLYLA